MYLKPHRWWIYSIRGTRGAAPAVHFVERAVLRLRLRKFGSAEARSAWIAFLVQNEQVDAAGAARLGWSDGIRHAWLGMRP